MAVERAAAEPVDRVVFVFLTHAGAVERELADLPGAKQAVLTAVGAG